MKKILGVHYLLVIISVIYFLGCGGDDVVQDPAVLILKYNKNRGNPLTYEFTVTWSGHSDGQIHLIYDPSSNQGPASNRYLGSIPTSQTSGTITANFTFPDNNPSPTTYTVFAVLWETGTTHELARSSPTQITVSYKKFNIIQLSMTGDDLWPNFLPSYHGLQQRDAAFGDANLIINSTINRTGLSNTTDPDGNPIEFINNTKMTRWAILHAYGSFIGVDPKVSILCGIDDVSTAYMGNNPNEVTTGFTMPDYTYTVPQLCFVLYSRIRNYYSSNGYDQIRVITGAAIHELGHAIGTKNDDPNIDPPHSGININPCVKRIPNPPDVYTNCVFCTGHITFISTQNWFL